MQTKGDKLLWLLHTASSITRKRGDNEVAIKDDIQRVLNEAADPSIADFIGDGMSITVKITASSGVAVETEDDILVEELTSGEASSSSS